MLTPKILKLYIILGRIIERADRHWIMTRDGDDYILEGQFKVKITSEELNELKSIAESMGVIHIDKEVDKQPEEEA